MVAIRKGRKEDFESIISLLILCDLIHEDVGESFCQHTLVAENANGVIGVLGLEHEGHIGLIRSLAVHPDHRGEGIALALCTQMEEVAKAESLVRLYLLTTTAQSYFSELGYHELDKELAPLPIKNSSQFSTLCPDSAILMEKSLSQVAASEAFDSGLYCAESVLSTVAEHFNIKSDLIPAISTGLCSGMARTCGPCGALSGGVLATSLIYGRRSTDDSVEKNYQATQQLAGEFVRLYGSNNCQELLGCDLGSDEGQSHFIENKLYLRCREYTKLSVELSVCVINQQK